MHYYWIGAVPAMIFLGLVMMPFYYGAKVRSVTTAILVAAAPVLVYITLGGLTSAIYN